MKSRNHRCANLSPFAVIVGNDVAWVFGKCRPVNVFALVAWLRWCSTLTYFSRILVMLDLCLIILLIDRASAELVNTLTELLNLGCHHHASVVHFIPLLLFNLVKLYTR